MKPFFFQIRILFKLFCAPCFRRDQSVDRVAGSQRYMVMHKSLKLYTF